MPVAIDFETYYDKEYSLKTLGVDSYCADDRFDPYLVAIVDPEQDLRYVGHPKDAPWGKVTGRTALAHNARFDQVVFTEAQKRGIIPASVAPKEWKCTADLAVYHSGPRSLAGASRELLDRTRDKSTRKKMEKMSRQEQIEAGMQEEVDEYAMQDSVDCWELYDKWGDQWPAHEQRISHLNREAGIHGVQINTEALADALDHIQTLKWKAERNIPWEWEDGKTPLAPTKLRLQCREANIPAPASLAADSKECAEWEAKYGDEYPWVGAMRDWRRTNIIEKRLLAIKVRLRDDGVMPFSIKYFGAHTGRFSGDGGFNMQNMPRGEMFGVDIRKMFVPRPGKKFIVADLSQIEARVLLWLAGDFEMLELIANGLSVYEAHAVATMGYTSQPDVPMKDAEPDLYRLAKARVLGLGFQCGAARFVDVARIMAGVHVTPEEAKQVVADYRDKNPRVTQLWRSLQNTLIKSTRDECMSLVLPSGRALNYFKVSGQGGYSAEIVRGERREKTYGGRLAENITQATARDVFTNNWRELVDAGLPPLWHVHDEFIIEVDESDVTDAVATIEEILSTTPVWLDGCPMGAEVKVADEYLK